jgi:anti-sigma-K factor RskA
MTGLSQDDIAFAAEYALGLLDGAGTASANARLASDPAFMAEVETWRVHLQPILDGPDIVAPDNIWDKISARLPSDTMQDNGKSKLRLWQGFSLISVSTAAALAAVLVLQPAAAPETPQSPMIAALGSENSNAAVTASYNSKSGQILLTPVSLKTGTLFPELWIIPADGKARSLGIVTSDHATVIDVPLDMRAYFDTRATLAITPEPAGGAPNGKATGPVIASGKIIIV